MGVVFLVMHCRKSLLFDNETACTKKNYSNMFDLTMGSFDGGEMCELIGRFLLGTNGGLYRDDELVLLRKASESQSAQKGTHMRFKKQGLSISTSAGLKICKFIDVTPPT